MKQFVFFLSISLIGLSSFAQKQNITGIIMDTATNIPISLASVAILSQKDSILQAFTRSNNEGGFTINDLKDGNYILLVSYPRYSDYVDYFSVMEGNGLTKNMGTIALTPTAKLLDEIVIGQSPIMIKGDTTIYIADSFKVRENASVEELLKELPGIQVDKDGKIIAQGKQVQKVLVDGDEFFGDDPTIATRNLRADAVSRVQVYDKRSDQAAFTGIDDGNEVKTIDLQLKEDARKGYFGKASVAGLDKYYNATAMLSAFKAKRKFSIFGVTSSTDQTGLNDMDQNIAGFGDGGMRFGGGRGGMITVGSLSVSRMGGSSFSAGNAYGQGLPESIKAGVHYNDKWNGGNNSVNGNYIFNKIDIRTGGNTFSQNTLFDSVYYNKSSSTNNSGRIQQSLSGSTDIQIDSSSSIKITIGGNNSSSDSYSEDRSEALSEQLKTVNTSDRKTSSHNDNNSFNTTAFYRKRFKKEGRTISINLSQRYNNTKSNGLLDNVSQFFDQDGNMIREELTDQNKVNTTLTQTWEGKLTFTNPAGKNSFVEFDYSLNHNDNNQKRLSYDKDPSGKYTTLVDSLSNDFQYTYNTHTGSVNYRYNGKKFSFTTGGSISNTGFEQLDRFESSQRSYSYTNLFPRADIRYKLNSFSNLSINYSGRTTQPTIDQIQPLKNNDDPLNIIVGNPDLKQSFSNSIGLNFNSYQMMTDQYLFLGGNFSTTANQINSSYEIDNLGRQVTKYINVNGNYSTGMYGTYSRKIGKTWRGGFSPNANYSRTTNIINGKNNISKTLTISPGLSINKRDAENYEFSLDYRPSYNSSKSSISTAASRNYWIQNISLDARYSLPLKIDISSNLTYENRQKLDANDDNNQLILWNASIEKRFLKKEQLTVSFSIHDILNDNKGYQRLIQPNSIVEKNYLTFQRYGLITLTYNFNTTGVGGGQQRNVMRPG